MASLAYRLAARQKNGRPTDNDANPASGLFGFGDRVVHPEELLDPSDFQGGNQPVIATYQGELASVLVLRDVSADERANSGRVDVGNVREIRARTAQ